MTVGFALRRSMHPLNVRTIACILLSVALTGGLKSNAQNRFSNAVPFLKIAPDARSSGMGDVGVATDPDVNSMHWNAAKYVFMESDWGAGITYTPWLPRLADGMGLSSLNLYRNFGESQAIAFSLKFFSHGDFQFSDTQGNQTGNYRPYEFSIDAAYVRKLSPSFSTSVTFRYLQSAVGAYSFVEGNRTQGNGVSADVGAYYSGELYWGETGGKISVGACLSNLGPEINYGIEKRPLPTNFRLGTTIKKNMGAVNFVSFSVDIDKPIVLQGYDGNHYLSENVYLSSAQALRLSSGFEFGFKDIFFLRTGGSYTSTNFANQRYFSVGTGFKIGTIGTDFSYLLPYDLYNPIGNTIRIGLFILFI